MRSARLFTATSVLKTEFFIPISSDEKDTTSGFTVLANHLASFFFLTLSGDSFGLLSWPLHPLLYPCDHRGLAALGFHADLDSQLPSTGMPRSWPTFLIPLLTVNLWGLSIQTRGGRGNFLFLSSQWQTTWHSITGEHWKAKHIGNYFTIEMHWKYFFYNRNALETVFTIRMHWNLCTIEMHWKLFYYRNALERFSL